LPCAAGHLAYFGGQRVASAASGFANVATRKAPAGSQQLSNRAQAFASSPHIYVDGACGIAVFDGGLRGGQQAVLFGCVLSLPLNFADQTGAAFFDAFQIGEAISSVSNGFGVSTGQRAFYVGHVAVFKTAAAHGGDGVLFADVCKELVAPSPFAFGRAFGPRPAISTNVKIRVGMICLTRQFRQFIKARMPAAGDFADVRFDSCRTENWPPALALFW